MPALLPPCFASISAAATLALYFVADLLTGSYPYVIAVVFLIVFFITKIPSKKLFFLRALTALVIAIGFAHLNRSFHLYPPHLLFPSGHMTFCLGISISLAMLRPWTLAITLPLLIPFGLGLVDMHFHTPFDVLGAIPLVAVVYGSIHWFWRMPPPIAAPVPFPSPSDPTLNP